MPLNCSIAIIVILAISGYFWCADAINGNIDIRVSLEETMSKFIFGVLHFASAISVYVYNLASME